MTVSVPIRQPCPPAACTCGRETLLEIPGSDLRVLRLTRHEENRLLERLENLTSLEDLERMQQRIYQQLGIRLQIAPGFNEVRSVRGIRIEIAELPGLCRKTRQSIPAAIRRALEKRPEIVYSLLNANDLLRDA
jgi:CRP-like cAMP-binding protein